MNPVAIAIGVALAAAALAAGIEKLAGGESEGSEASKPKTRHRETAAEAFARGKTEAAAEAKKQSDAEAAKQAEIDKAVRRAMKRAPRPEKDAE